MSGRDDWNQQPGPKNSVIYVTTKGTEYIVLGGDRNFRNNNPGNLRSGKMSKKNGEIGVVGGFAVFPYYETGKKAMMDSLKEVGDITHMAGLEESKTVPTECRLASRTRANVFGFMGWVIF